MMYYRKALELQAFLDMAKDDGNLHTPSYEFCSQVLSLSIVICLILICTFLQF